MFEISSFETSSFSRRQFEKAGARSKSPLQLIRAIGVALLIAGLIGSIWVLSMNNVVQSTPIGPVITPTRLLVIMTLCLIILTPVIRPKKLPVDVPLSRNSTGKPTPAAQQLHAPDEIGHQEPINDAQETQRFISQYSPEIIDLSRPLRRLSPTHRASAPFVDDVHSTQRHEFTELLPVWARKMEELLIMPQIVVSLMNSLEESDRILSQCFARFGFRLSNESVSRVSTEPFGAISLSDRFLPNPVSNEPGIVAEWQRRQMLESLVNIPGYPAKYRDYVVGRIKHWATRGGIRFAYRHDTKPDESGPTDSHILSHLLFASLESLMGGGFRDRYVVTAQSGSFVMDEFQALFSSVRSNISGSSYGNRVAWLEQSAKSARGPVHFNVGTNQRVYGITPGGGNVIEALCLFFYLLRRLGSASGWVHLPHDIRVVIEAAIGCNDPVSGSLAGSFFGSKGSAMGALPDLYRGH
jgi:hypothetical protein